MFRNALNFAFRVQANAYPAFIDSKFAGSGYDACYLTTMPGKRGVFYAGTATDPAVIAMDEQLNETATVTDGISSETRLDL